MHSLYIFFFFFLTFVVLPEEILSKPMRGDPTLRKYCGSSLFDAINTACHGKFGGPTATNIDGHANFVKREGGAATQCCRRGCSWDMLREFCAADVSDEDYSIPEYPPSVPVANSIKKEKTEEEIEEETVVIPEKIIWQPATIGRVSDEFTKKAITMP